MRPLLGVALLTLYGVAHGQSLTITVNNCPAATTSTAPTAVVITCNAPTQPPTDPPSTEFPSSCGSLSVIPFNSPPNLAYETRYEVRGMSGATVAMGRFITGNAGSDTAQFSLADVSGATVAYRKLYVAPTACDFAFASAGPTIYPTFRYTVGANPPKLGYKNLLPNTTYYVMAKQENASGPNCQSGGCGFSLVLHATNN